MRKVIEGSGGVLGCRIVHCVWCRQVFQHCACACAGKIKGVLFQGWFFRSGGVGEAFVKVEVVASELFGSDLETKEPLTDVLDESFEVTIVIGEGSEVGLFEEEIEGVTTYSYQNSNGFNLSVRLEVTFT